MLQTFFLPSEPEPKTDSKTLSGIFNASFDLFFGLADEFLYKKLIFRREKSENIKMQVSAEKDSTSEKIRAMFSLFSLDSDYNKCSSFGK